MQTAVLDLLDIDPFDLIEDEEPFAADVPAAASVVLAHLPGLHDQSTHGRRRGRLSPQASRLTQGNVEGVTGKSALAKPPASLAKMTAKGDRRADALWFRTGDNNAETGSLPGYVGMSQFLRQTGWANPAMAARVDDIDSVMAESKLREPVVVFRGIQSLDALWMTDDATGSTFQDMAFASTTTDPEHALEFGPVQARIRVPAGVGAIRMADRDPGKPESEILLDRGLTYKIVSDTSFRDQDGRREQRIIELEVQP